MHSQQKAESDLLRIYGRMITIILVLVILAVIGNQYFSSMPQVAARSAELAHARFLNVLAMVHSRWLSLGKPQQLQLDWEVFTDQRQAVGPSVVNMSVVNMSPLGWPLPKQLDHRGCQELWLQLMGSELQEDTLMGEFFSTDTRCRYRSQNGDSIDYRLNSGGVIFLTGK